MDIAFKKKLENLTPVFQEIREFEDADEEMQIIADYLVEHVNHNDNKEPKRIKFLYSDKPKKEGTRFGLFELIRRSKIEKMISDNYDFILTVFYHAWKELEPEQKVIQLDKALCGIDMGSLEQPKLGKKSPDSKEYTENMNFFGADKVMNTSEMVDLVCQRIMDERKEEEKAKKESKKDKNKLKFTE